MLTAAVAALLAAGVALHARAPVPSDGRSSFERLLADSAEADSAAIETLPRSLAALDLRTRLTPEGLEELSAECRLLPTDRRRETRRQVAMKMEDGSTILVYVAADDSTGSLDRVEFIHRIPQHGQRGLTWDARHDHTSSAWFPEPERGVRRRIERGKIPRGGPVPRALRAAGRQLLTLPCAPARTRR